MTELKIHEAVSEAKSTLAIEGLHMPEDIQVLILQKLAGTITEKEFRRAVLKGANNE